MPIPFVNAVLPNNLVAPSPVNPVVGRGSLVTFNYLFYKHDPQPLVLITDPDYRDSIRGVNLHNLTFPVIKKLLSPAPGPNFTYQYIKGNEFVKSAFRQYKKNGIQYLKKMDIQFIVNAMAINRYSFDPNEIEAVRKSVREQIRRIINPQAAQSSEMPR